MLTRESFLTLTPAQIWMRLIVSLASLMRAFMALRPRAKQKALRHFEQRLRTLEHFAAMLLGKFALGLPPQPAGRAAPRTLMQTDRAPPQTSSVQRPAPFHLPKALTPVLFPDQPARIAVERKSERKISTNEASPRPSRIARFFRRAGALRRLLLQPDKFSASLARRLERRAEAPLGTFLPFTEEELAHLMHDADTFSPGTAAPQEAAHPPDEN
jgi:hypothetical protein